MAVTVVLPLEPVMANIVGLGMPDCAIAKAKSSTSPTTGIPSFTACRTNGSASATPGLMAIRSRPANVSAANDPTVIWTRGRARFNSPRQGGSVRVSAARTSAPLRDSHLAMESPDSPIPSTNTVFPHKFIRFWISSQLQCRQSKQYQHHGNDPEPYHYLIFLPALQFVVVMQRRHAKNTSTDQLERSNLQHHG